ncbi:LapA family protein [Verrucomicrobiaceae bacterium N1E253]|uniref:LapA family protein n=1 Tax=Oceaniferula marina TaxID=2748318 RepID=A0A851GME1_9BACT|nr:LapA family protein [Oceaniferula marina]NWK57011.1 LapA family protein [Oceaniferula marina]
MDAKKIKLIVSAVVVLLLGVIVFQNYQEVTVQVLMASITMPLAILLLLTFAIGLTLGWLFKLFRASPRK